MTVHLQSDVAVIGAGMAGLVAANRAAQLGLKALVLEQSAAEKYLCNSRYTGGTLHIAYCDIMADADELMRTITESTQGHVRPELARMFADEGRRVVRWLQDEGSRFLKASPAPYHRWVLAPPGRVRPGLDWEGRSGDVLLRMLEANLVKRGGALMRGVRARALVSAEGACTGLDAITADGAMRIDARAVVIADGGFQADPELVGRYITPHPQRLMQRNAGTGRGDGLRMAQAIGAALIGTDRFYGHVLSRDALHNAQLWPYPYLDSLVAAAIVVASAGERFADEGAGGVSIANMIAHLADPLDAWVVFDQASWETAGKHGLIPANPHLPRVGGTLHTATDLETLARTAGITASALAQTVTRYNAALAQGRSTTLAPPRSAKKGKPQPIATPPYYAAPVCAGITYTMGGVMIDEHARALDAERRPLPGLYVAGAAAGGLEGGPAIGYVGGLVKCGVTGLRAAEHIADRLLGRA
ncbi:MAG: FAD-binding protein [Betaproteobacteria bacterium]|nr:MAG: FAD-binding protein [Betaproteobacteria bacterium]